MTGSENVIPAGTFQRGTTRCITELHITGGARAVERGPRLWMWHPVLVAGATRALAPMPIDRIDRLADNIGLQLFGGDEQSDLEGPLISRVWTPLEGPGNGSMQPADAWRSTARNADQAGDAEYAILARHIAFSLSAAGIRLRDASDAYRAQLMAAIQSRRAVGTRFSNIPIRDLQLAFHSILSELASARDYLAAALASKLAAPPKVDAMNRFAEWLDASSKAELRERPVVREMLDAYRSVVRRPLASPTHRIS